jgi:AcrR family transcriptional regulator
MVVSTRPRRRLDRVRRPQILATAVELLREKGIWSVRISDIAHQAGMSPTSVLYYFGSKDQLLAQAIEQADAAFYAGISGEMEALTRASDRLVLLITSSSASEWVLWMELWAYARHHPDIAPDQRRFSRRWRGAIAEVLRYGQSTGEWSLSDADAAALRLAALTDGLAVHMVLGEDGHSPASYVEMALYGAASELGVDARELMAAAGRVGAHGGAGQVRQVR